jgi:putative aldouronate transport system substrate-binding protein
MGRSVSWSAAQKTEGLSYERGGFIMKFKKVKQVLALILSVAMVGAAFTGCQPKATENKGTTVASGEKKGGEPVELVWYQIGDPQADMEKVVQKVNEYTKDKIGVTLKINQIGWGDYNKKMQVLINTGEVFDLMFTCSWANDYVVNAQKGAFLALDDLLPKYGKDMQKNIDPKFWEAAKVGGVTYAIPNEKEIGSMPMWVFTKEYIDKYNIPYKTIKTTEDLEPWLKLIKEKEPDVIPFYLTKDFSAPTYMDKVQDPIGIEYDCDPKRLVVKNVFETEKMQSTLKTIRKYFQAGYINKDAATASDDKNVKRFATKGDGQPYAELIWSKDLGYDVVSTPIMDTVVTNASARGAMTGVSRTSKHPEKAVEFLNLVNSDEYLRNLLNYGIEGVQYTKVKPTAEEIKKTEGKPNVYANKIHLIEENRKNYSVPYWVEGGLFNTYVTDKEPLDKWAEFQAFNKASITAPSFGFDFNTEPVATQIAGFRGILDEFGAALYTGSVDPNEVTPKLIKKLEATGVNDVIKEMQKQIDEWQAAKK